MLNIGDPATPFSGEDILTGETFSLSDHQGEVVLIAFMGLTWCPPCQYEAPILQSLWEEFQSSPCIPRVQFVIVSTVDDLAELPAKLQQFGITMPVLTDSSIPPLYEIDSVPTFYVVGSNQKICNRKTAITPAEELRQLVHTCEPLVCEPVLRLDQWLAVGRILFGVIQDAPGIVIVGGKPRPVDPWDPLRRMAPEKRDLLLELGISELAGQLRDAKARRDLETRALRGAETAIKGLLAKSRHQAMLPERTWSPLPKRAKARGKKR